MLAQISPGAAACPRKLIPLIEAVLRVDDVHPEEAA